MLPRLAQFLVTFGNENRPVPGANRGSTVDIRGWFRMKKQSNSVFAALVLAAATFGGAELVSAHDAKSAQTISGSASWYGGHFHGRQTANGERYDMNGLTAAHKTLPFGTKVRVTNNKNGRSVVVRVNDRGPYHGNRIIDLSKGAATAVGLTDTGVAPVKVEVLNDS